MLRPEDSFETFYYDCVTLFARLKPRAAALAACLALVWPMTQAEVDRALSIGRAFDRERAQFHTPYIIPIADPTVERLEIVTEFRRVVLFAEEQIRKGDHMFGLREAERAVAPWHGKVTIVARLRFHPLNTFIDTPPYQVVIGNPPLEALAVRRTSLYAVAGPNPKPGTHAALNGAIVEADFDAEAVAHDLRPVRVMLEGKEVARATVDFGRLE
jgi:hypothetical protein